MALLKQIYEGQQRLETEQQELRVQNIRLEAQNTRLETLKAENKSLKRGLEQVQSELAKRPSSGLATSASASARNQPYRSPTQQWIIHQQRIHRIAALDSSTTLKPLSSSTLGGASCRGRKSVFDRRLQMSQHDL
jgi:hypothetical protein